MIREICPICGMGQLHEHCEEIEVEHKGDTIHLLSKYSICDHCGSEQADASQVAFNKKAMLDFKSHYMSKEERITSIREKVAKMTPNELLTKLESYPAAGPLAFPELDTHNDKKRFS